MNLSFPKNFIWGAATAAHQVEGNNKNSDFWLLENFEDTIFAEPSGKACDQWNLYEEDIKLVADCGMNSYRLSVEWAKIEPEKNNFSQESIDHYKKVLECCHKYGLKTCVTYQHFTSPLWFTVDGGWEDKKNISYFIRYCEKVTKELGNLIDIVCTINEANLTACFAYNFPNYPKEGMKTIMPFIERAAKQCNSTLDNFGPFLFGHPMKIKDCMMQAHVESRDIIKSHLKKNQPVGITLSIQDYQALEGGESQRLQALLESVDCCLEKVADDDFVGIQTYTRHLYGPKGITKLNVGDNNVLEMMGYEYYPESLENVLRYVSTKIKTPMIVTENGIATSDDNQRIEFVKTALKGVQNCLDGEIDIRGYYYWSLLDNFEWIYGYKPRFGLVEVDLKTQVRKPKSSMNFLKTVIQNSRTARSS